MERWDDGKKGSEGSVMRGIVAMVQIGSGSGWEWMDVYVDMWCFCDVFHFSVLCCVTAMKFGLGRPVIFLMALVHRRVAMMAKRKERQAWYASARATYAEAAEAEASVCQHTQKHQALKHNINQHQHQASASPSFFNLSCMRLGWIRMMIARGIRHTVYGIRHMRCTNGCVCSIDVW